MFGWLNRIPLRGLANVAHRKISGDPYTPSSLRDAAFPLALAIAHAAYPSANFGDADADALLRRLPTPVLGWDAAGKVAHRYVHFGDFGLEDCLRQQYGVSALAILQSLFGERRPSNPE